MDKNEIERLTKAEQTASLLASDLRDILSTRTTCLWRRLWSRQWNRSRRSIAA